MRHQYVIVGLLSVICGLLGYIAAKMTTEPTTQQAAKVVSTSETVQAQSNRIPEQKSKRLQEWEEKYKDRCGGIVHAKSKYNGTVKTEFTFDKLGNAQDVKLVQSSGYADLDADAIAFAQAITGGKYGEKICFTQTFSTQSEVVQPAPDYPPPPKN